MSTPAPVHRCLVDATPWPGVHGVRIESGRHFSRHWHATYGIGVLARGAQRSASGRGPVEAHAGELITTNPGEVHDGRPLGQPSRRWRMLYLEPETLQAVLRAPGEATAELELVRPVIADVALRQDWLRLFARLDAWSDTPGDGTAALACEEALAQACAGLRARHATDAPPREADADMAPVRDRLADELLAPPTLAELAAGADLSRFQLLRRFEKAYGLPPHAWLMQQRTERARRLVGDGLPLAQAAAASGFADQSHMTRAFMRQFGFTPGAWRRAAGRR